MTFRMKNQIQRILNLNFGFILFSKSKDTAWCEKKLKKQFFDFGAKKYEIVHNHVSII